MAKPTKSKPAPKPTIKRKMGRPKGRSIDWTEAERSYVQGDVDAAGVRTFPSYAELAGRYGVTRNAVAFRGGDFDWPAKREAFQRALRDATDKKLIETVSERVAAVGALGAAVAERALRAIDRVLESGYPDGPLKPPLISGTKVVMRPEAAEFSRLASGFKWLIEGVAAAKGAILGKDPPPGEGESGDGAEPDAPGDGAVGLAAWAVLGENQAPGSHGTTPGPSPSEE